MKSTVHSGEKPRILACIPAYNEEKTIAKVVIEAKKHVDEVIVCDDGSSDMTAEIAENLGATVIRHRQRMGKGAAMNTLFRHAREIEPDVILTLDADGQHDPNQIPDLVRVLEEHQADMVVGSRFLMGRSEQMPGYRAAGNRILNFATGGVLTDTQSGFRAYRLRVLENIMPTETGMGVDSEIIMKASQLGLNIIETQISTEYKVPKGSKQQFLHHGLDVLATTIKHHAIHRPLLVFGLPAIVFAALSFVIGMWAIDTYISTGELPFGPTIAAGFSFMIALVLATTALIIYVLTSLIREAQDRGLQLN